MRVRSGRFNKWHVLRSFSISLCRVTLGLAPQVFHTVQTLLLQPRIGYGLLASWVGIGPGNNESAGKRKSGRIRKGNAWVRRLLCEFAQAAGRSRCALKAKFQALSVRKGHKRSIMALGHKMLRTIYAGHDKGDRGGRAASVSGAGGPAELLPSSVRQLRDRFSSRQHPSGQRSGNAIGSPKSSTVSVAGFERRTCAA